MFKKKKISKSKMMNIAHLIKIQKGFLASKTKTSLISVGIGFISVCIIGIIAFGVIKQISSAEFGFQNILNNFGINFSIIENENEGSGVNIKKSPDGKTNILIIGRGGKENDAPDLTDSIIIASIHYEKQFISMFSIPRDLYVDYPTGYKGRINETYFRGLKKSGNEIGGIDALKEVVKKITQEEIHYYANIDFAGFREIIDTLGGIDIDVPQAITDHTYPGPNHSYQTFSIKAGPQTLDGATALKYARSRHTTSDFDRSLRQQLIVKAIREKVLSLGVFTSPSKIKGLYSVINKNFSSDLQTAQIIALALYLQDIPKENIISSNLNDTCFYGSAVCEKGGFLTVPPRDQFNGASVLLQEGGSYNDLSNYDSLEKYTNLIFNHPHIYTENLQINVFNATKIGGLAQEVASKLKKYGFFIPDKNSIGNTSGEIYEKSKILYSTGSGETKPETVKALELFIFGGSENVESLPKYSKDENTKIEIIIGNDYKLLNF